MGQALYRKYRSKRLSEIVGQEHITHTLEQALKTGRISHAYLFTGPRGVGKTSIARILAHEINGLPYEDDQAHIDIMEIDAASNRRIDEIRDLRDKVFIAPASAKYKVYIIDEVHMLTREAFNALLKTLEEPPAHAVFILATTEAHKLPETIVSRTQRFIFRPIDTAKATAHLKEIAQDEKIDITDEALELIARHGGGSFRDSISLLDQAGSQGGSIDLKTVQQMLGIPPEEAIADLLTSLSEGEDAATLLQQLDGLYEQGFQAAELAKQLGRRLRKQLVEGAGPLPTDKTAALLAQLLEVPVAHDPERYLEIILLAAAGGRNSETKPAAKAPSEPPKPAAKSKKAPPKTTASPEPPAPAEEPPESEAAEAEPAPQAEPEDTAPNAAVLDDANWLQVLSALKKEHNTLYGIVRMAKPDFSRGGHVKLTFAFAFHQKRVHEAKNRQIVADAIRSITGGSVTIECILDPELKLAAKPSPGPHLPEVPAAAAPASDSLNTISNIFGGGELLQS